MQKIRIRQTRSTIRQKKIHQETLKALGLGKIGKSSILEVTPSVAGMIRSVSHLVEIKPAE